MKEIFDTAFSVIKKNAAQIILITFVIAAIESVYVCFLYICSAISIPGFAKAESIAEVFPEHFSAEIIITLLIGLVAGYLIVTPLSFGAAWCFYQAAQGRQIPLECFCSCMINRERRSKVWKINVVSTGSRLMTYIAAAALLRTCQIAERQFNEQGFGAGAHLVLFILTSALMMCIFIVYLMLTARYFIVPYAFADDPDCDVRTLLLRAVKMTRGSRNKIINLTLLMIPMYSLCIFGFPLVLVIPFTKALMAALAVHIFRSAPAAGEEAEDVYFFEDIDSL